MIHYFCTFFLDSLRVFRTTYFYTYSMEVYIFHENNMQWLSTLVFNPVHMIIHIGFHFCVHILLHFESTLYHPRFFGGVRVSSLFSFLCRVCVCVCVCVFYIVLFVFVLCIVCTMLPVFLDFFCSFLFSLTLINGGTIKINGEKIE